MNFIADHMCFACGRDNPIGLKLRFRQEGEEYVATFVADRVYQGYEGVVHGGIVATLLDEAMARLVWERVGPAATARLDIRYRKPTPTGTPIEVRGRITSERRSGQIFETAADIRLPDGTVLAEATGMVIKIDPKSTRE